MGTSDGASQIYKIVRTFSALWKLNITFSWPSTRGKLYCLPLDYEWSKIVRGFSYIRYAYLPHKHGCHLVWKLRKLISFVNSILCLHDTYYFIFIDHCKSISSYHLYVHILFLWKAMLAVSTTFLICEKNKKRSKKWKASTWLLWCVLVTMENKKFNI
jgi:hypothetical protein